MALHIDKEDLLTLLEAAQRKIYRCLYCDRVFLNSSVFNSCGHCYEVRCLMCNVYCPCYAVGHFYPTAEKTGKMECYTIDSMIYYYKDTGEATADDKKSDIDGDEGASDQKITSA